MNNIYSKAYTEVIESIKHFSEDEYKKIPKDIIDFFEKNKDKDYKFIINPNADLAEQNISQNANAILVSLFRDYFATDNQKEILKNLLQQNQEKVESEKYLKYNPDNLFENHKKEFIEEIQPTANEVSMVKYNESILERFINKIKRIFHLK